MRRSRMCAAQACLLLFALGCGNGDDAPRPPDCERCQWVQYDVGTMGLASVAPTQLGDVDGDGALDLVVAADAGVAILKGSADARFAAPSFFGDAPVSSLSLGDLDGDARADLAFIHGTIPKLTLEVVPNLGDGAFGAPIFVLPDSTPTVLTGDFDGDGWIDLAMRSTNGFYTGFLPNEGGSLSEPFVSSPLDFGSPDLAGAMAIGDLNGDGRPDIYSAGRVVNDQGRCCPKTYPPFSVGYSYSAQRQPTMQRMPSAVGDYFAFRVAIADFNEDGRDDVAELLRLDVAHGSLYVTTGANLGGLYSAVAAGDVDHDGHADLLAVAEDYLYIFHGNGDGTFGFPLRFESPAATSLVVADLDDDGWPEVIASSGNDVSVLRNLKQL